MPSVPRSRAYRKPQTAAETARRIARSIQDHAAQGIQRDASHYGARPDVAQLVAQLLSSTRKAV